MKRYRILSSIFLSVLFVLPCRADPDSRPTFMMDENFFDGIPITPKAEILLVAVDLKALPHGDADAELIQYLRPDAARRPDSCGLDSSPDIPFSLDCGVTMLGLETRGDQAVYYFLLKARQGDWYQIVLTPQSGATTWIKDQHTNGLVMSTHPLFEWLQSLGAYHTAHEIVDPVRAVPVRNHPEDTAEDLTDCASYEDGEGLIPAKDKTRSGDWVHVVCLENECFTPADPLRACIPNMSTQRVPCVEGWARWRNKEGHLILYPYDESQECS